MFPFSSILEGVDRGLNLSPANVNVFGGWNDAAYAGFRFDEDRTFYHRRKQVYNPQTNEWVHEDSKPVLVGNDFECMVDNVDESALGTGTWSKAGTDGVWHSLHSDRLWYVFIYGTQFEGHKSGTVTGDMHIREKAVPSNIASSTFILTAQYEGQS